MITTQKEAIPENEELQSEPMVTLSCWRCGASLADMPPATRTGSGERVCPGCTAVTQYQDGIWLSLAPEQADHFGRFIAEYEFIRAAEGPGIAASAYYFYPPYDDTRARIS